jgi:hypothetical protein
MGQWVLSLKLSGHSLDVLNYMIKTYTAVKIKIDLGRTGGRQIDPMTIHQFSSVQIIYFSIVSLKLLQ